MEDDEIKLLFATVATLLLLAATAQARPATPPALVSVNHAVAATHHWQRLAHKPVTPYRWGAHHTTTSTAARWRIASRWWDHARDAYADYRHYLATQPTWSVPAWFYESMRCISDHEEYGYDGPNTSAGYIGMISSPSAYAASVHASYRDDVLRIVAQYGNSWLGIPLMPQLVVAYGLYLRFNNFSPWSTAPGCGL